MNILLVNPYIYDFTAYDLWLRPLGLLYIAGVLKEYTNENIYYLDTLDRFQYPDIKTKEDGRGKYFREIVDKPEIYESVPRYYARYGMKLEDFYNKIENLPEIDFILITSLMTYWIDGINFTLNELKKRFKRAKIIFGGLIPSLIMDDSKRFVNADYYVSGYGESQILQILKDNGVKIKNHPDLNNIDNLPFPYYEFLSNKKYLPILTSRGCPFRCTYCASHILNKRFIQRNTQKVIDEILFHYEKYETEHFIVFDDAFLVNKKKHFFKIFNAVKKEINVKFHTPNGLHVREIDKETAKLLYESGFRTLRLSFESIDELILERSSNKVNTSQMHIAIENLVNAGFKKSDIEVYLLYGQPDQKIDDIVKSIEFVDKLGVIPHLSYFSPVPNTIDFLKLVKKGLLKYPVDLYETNKMYFIYTKSGLSEDDITNIREFTNKIILKNRGIIN